MEAEQHATSESRARAAEAVPVAAAAEQEQETTSSTEVEQDAAVSRRELRHAHKKRRNFSPLIKIAIIILGVVALVYTGDRKSTRLNSSHVSISYAVFCL